MGDVRLRVMMEFILQILQSLTGAWADIISFVSSIQADVPSWRALALSAGIAAAVALLLFLIIRRAPVTCKMKELLVEPGEDRFIRLTKEKMTLMGVREGALRKISIGAPSEDKAWTTVRVLQRNRSNKFTDDVVAVSQATLMRLGLEVDEKRLSLDIVLKELPFYSPLGLWNRTFGSPRQDHRITSWVTLLTTVIGISTSHFYYWLSTVEQQSALRPSLVQGLQTEPADSSMPRVAPDNVLKKSADVSVASNLGSSSPRP